jgi:hypothetical protein
MSTGDWRDKDNLLHRVWSPKKKNELFKVLQNPNASHFERLWLVGFLKWVKYGYKDILNIIHALNEWRDYDSHITKIQVHSVFYSSHGDNRPYRSKPAGTLNKGSHSLEDEPADTNIPPEPICTADRCLSDRTLVRTLKNQSNLKKLREALQIITLIDELESYKERRGRATPQKVKHKTGNGGTGGSALHSSRFSSRKGGDA